MMTARRKEERLIQLLSGAYEYHQQWRQAQEKVVGQLRSMKNLTEQLASLRRCRDSGRLGSVSWYPQLVTLLEGKILSSFERALDYAHKARYCVKMGEYIDVLSEVFSLVRR